MKLIRNTFIGAMGLTLILNVSSQSFERCAVNEHLMDPPECPSFEEMPTYFSYPYDCTKFFQCNNGDARCIQCPVGTRWDQNLTTCNHEAVIDCIIVTTSRPSTTTTVTMSTTTPKATTTTPITTPTTTRETPEDPIEWICDLGYEGPVGHPYLCTHFYICDPGRRPCLFECPGNLYYNPETKNCAWPWEVPSCQGGTPPPPTILSPANYRNIPRLQRSNFVASLMELKSKGQDPCGVNHNTILLR